MSKKSFDNLVTDLRKVILTKSQNLPTPCYLFDSILVEQSAQRFKKAFSQCKLNPQVFYALKSNPYPGLIKTLSQKNIGADVSSIDELKIAVKSGAKKIIVTGPGKTKQHLKVFLQEKKVEMIFLDSVEEIKRLNQLLDSGFKPANKKIMYGLRVVPQSLQSWDKFGVNLEEAKEIITKSTKTGSLFAIKALQFHISYVKSGKVFKTALKELSALASEISPDACRQIEIIDIGGGYTPETFEGVFPWNKKQLSLFDIEPLKKKILNAPSGKRAFFEKIEPIEDTARTISEAWSRYIKPKFINAKLQVEPGRYLSNNSMHILLSVVDKKNPQSIILNGGWNMLGWEKYQYINYSPVVNLTQWNPQKELPVVMYGNLCLPDDIWGYYLKGNPAKVEDLILLPCQGAYTYTYRQSFIRGIPKVYQCR